MNYARIVRVPKWQTFILNKLNLLLMFLLNDFENAVHDKLKSKKTLILIALFSSSLACLMIGFSLALVKYKIFGN